MGEWLTVPVDMPLDHLRYTLRGLQTMINTTIIPSRNARLGVGGLIARTIFFK